MVMKIKLWIVKMLFVWRWRLGYWDWQAFRAGWKFLPLLKIGRVTVRKKV